MGAGTRQRRSFSSDVTGGAGARWVTPPDVTANHDAGSLADPPARWPDVVPGGGLRRWVFLPAELYSVHQARLLAVAALADWHVKGITEDVCTCISELAANACRHARDVDGSVMRVSLHLMGRYLSVHVRDKSPRPPVPRCPPRPDETGVPDWASVDLIPEAGFGLHLVDELADGWGWWSLPVGKVVA